MVEGRKKLEFDSALLKRRRGGAGGGPAGESAPPDKSPLWRGGTVDRVMAASVALAVLILVISAIDTKKETWVAVVLLGLFFLASEWFALPMKSGGRLSLALLPVMIAILHTGPLGVALVPLFGIPIFYAERGGEGARRVIYNASQYVFCAGAAGLVFWHTGGDIILKAGKADLANALNSGNGAKLILPWLLATVVFFVFNTVLVTPALSQGKKERFLRFWEKRMLARFPGYLLYAGVGFLGAIAYSKLQFTAVVLLAVPLLVARVVYTRFGMMREVRDETTLAVMEAVESANVFSKGHSVGVAAMAAAIADEMDFREEDLHLLRQAALLHDVGLLALDPAVVGKPGQLTPEEYEQIKKHPLISARIAAKEESLAVIAPSITHHHELVDGSGYVDGLTGDTIPIGAKILAVADAFDAMQRKVPYREPLDARAAASEIVRAKGVMYDPTVVDAFMKVVIARGIWSGAVPDMVRMPERPVAGGVAAKPDTGQPTLDEALPEERAASGHAAGATPADGISYDDVRGDIEKDIREWKRSDGERLKRRARGEPKKRAASHRKKKDQGL